MKTGPYVVKSGSMYVTFKNNQHDGIYDIRLVESFMDEKARIYDLDVAKQIRDKVNGEIMMITLDKVVR